MFNLIAFVYLCVVPFANVEDGARLDVVAEGFWDRLQKAYFDVNVFNPLAPTYSSTSLPQCYRWGSLRKDECMKNVFGR